MKVGDRVRITKCDVCPKVVGKTAKVRSLFTLESGVNAVALNFGKGRPQINRPEVMGVDDVIFVED